MKYCEHNCGNIAKFKNKSGKHVCEKSSNSCPAIKLKNSNSLKRKHKEKPVWRVLTDEARSKCSWSRGLNKQNNSSLKSMAEKNSLNFSGENHPFFGKRHSQKTKQKISKKRIEYLESGKNSKWFDVNGVKVQGTWERNVAEWLTKNKIKWTRGRLRYCGHRLYTCDFFLEEHNLFIEVKGFMRERDKFKLFKVLEYNNIDLRILEKNDYHRLDSLNIFDIPKFTDVYDKKDIDMRLFKDQWS